MQSKRIITLFTVCILSIMIISGIPDVSAVETLPSDVRKGPYLDTITYKVMLNQNDRILALQAGNIEMDTSYFTSEYYDILDVDPDIDIFETTRNGYGHITINCRDAPLNESVLRRAFAFAYNKTKVSLDLFDGFAKNHDSVVPDPIGWCVEDDFEWNYYTDQSDVGNAILDASGDFEINGSTGFRTYRGVPFDIVIEYLSVSPDIGSGVAQIGVDALTELHIDAHIQPADLIEIISRLESHEEYDMFCYTQSFYGNDVDWLAYEYWSGYANTPYQNPTNFANTTYDTWRNQLLFSTSYENIYEAASEMQKILHYNVPKLVVYENTYLQGYRNDKFTGHVEAIARSISGPWTMRNIHKLDETLGGEASVAIANDAFNLNFFVSGSPSVGIICDNIYSSLYSLGPDLQPIPDLVETFITETHSDNGTVPTGHTRYTIDIVHNATWSDGKPLTAVDVASTFNYYIASGAFGNPAKAGLEHLISSTSPSTFRVILEFDIESYWLFSEFAYDYIIPEHIFNDDGISPSSWISWSAPQPSSGPFYVSSYSSGHWYNISRNPYFYYPAPNPVTELSEPTSSGIQDSNNLTILISIGSIGIILVVAVLIYKTKQT